MANIRGISIKAVKHFIGTEGPAYQGNIYIGSKKVAFWSQDGNGGPDWFDMMNGFSKRKLVEAMKPYVDQKSIELKVIDESFMYNLLWLTQTEKEFKKALKKGYKAMMKVTDGFRVLNSYYPDVPNCTAEALFMRINDDIKDNFFKNEEISYHLYKDISDFSDREKTCRTDSINPICRFCILHILGLMIFIIPIICGKGTVEAYLRIFRKCHGKKACMP